MAGTNAGRPAVVLFSGGLDSTTLLAYALHHGWDAYALTFRYGQRHDVEVARATALAAAATVTPRERFRVELRARQLAAVDAPGSAAVAQAYRLCDDEQAPVEGATSRGASH